MTFVNLNACGESQAKPNCQKRQLADVQHQPTKRLRIDGSSGNDNFVGQTSAGDPFLLNIFFNTKRLEKLNNRKALNFLKFFGNESLMVIKRLEFKEEFSSRKFLKKEIRPQVPKTIGYFIHAMVKRLQIGALTRDIAKDVVVALFINGKIDASRLMLKCLVILHIVAMQHESEKRVPALDAWLNCLQEPVSVKKFSHMELEILRILRDYFPNYCTPVHFIQAYSRVRSVSELPACHREQPQPEILTDENTMGTFSCGFVPADDLSLSFSSSLRVSFFSPAIIEDALRILDKPSLLVPMLPPSHVAAAALYLALVARGFAWPDCLVYLTGFTVHDLQPAIDTLNLADLELIAHVIRRRLAREQNTSEEENTEDTEEEEDYSTQNHV